MKIYDQIVVVIFLNLYVGPAYERDTIYVFEHSIFVPKILKIVIFIRMFCKSAVKNEKIIDDLTHIKQFQEAFNIMSNLEIVKGS